MRNPILIALAALTAPLLATTGATAIETRVFYATLAGTSEVPPNDSTAHGSATAGLNDDDSLTYTVTSTGFATPFLAAHVHIAPAGVAGPIIFPIDCHAAGTRCSGTSRPLTTAEREALDTGGTYVNLHSEAFPGGEIRGQLLSVALAPPRIEAPLMKFEGKATAVGKAPDPERKRGAEIRIKGRFLASDEIDLRERRLAQPAACELARTLHLVEDVADHGG